MAAMTPYPSLSAFSSICTVLLFDSDDEGMMNAQANASSFPPSKEWVHVVSLHLCITEYGSLSGLLVKLVNSVTRDGADHDLHVRNPSVLLGIRRQALTSASSLISSLEPWKGIWKCFRTHSTLLERKSQCNADYSFRRRSLHSPGA